MEFCALRCICGSLGKAFFNQFLFMTAFRGVYMANV